MPEKRRTTPVSRKTRTPAAATARVAKRTPEKKSPPIAARAKPPALPAARKTSAKPRARKAAAASTTTRHAAADAPILMVTPEAHPFATTGGLAEVAGGLSQALARRGRPVVIVMPRYRRIDVNGDPGLTFTVELGGRSQEVTCITRPAGERVTAVFVDAPALFDRDGLYGEHGRDYPDNAWRFAVFSRAALEYARRTGVRPFAIHAHDWQTGLVPVFQKMLFSDDPVVGGVPAVFTIHNLAFQGVFPAATLPQIGLDWNVFDIQALEYWNQISYLKGGINFSERITTVSPTYAREILTPEFGFGMEGVLSRRAGALTGILNGIDTDRWNPATDPFVGAPFSADDLSGKAEARKRLLEAVGLPASEAALARPIVGLMSRLTDQKGFDLLAAAEDELMALDATWVLLGSGERHYEDRWRALASRYPDRVSATIGYEEPLTHRIEAGADIFLMPSRFEPCGLNQLYSLRYGTVPVVHAVGGLDDTVTGGSASRKRMTGFKFHEYTPAALVSALRQALEAFARPAVWRDIQKAGMSQDRSWDASAREYVKVYEGLM